MADMTNEEYGTPLGSPYESNSPRMHLNLTGAAIHEAPSEEGPSDEPAPSIQLPNQDGEYISHIALDIGGSLIKLVYFSTHPTSGLPAPGATGTQEGNGATNSNGGNSRGGRLHFVKFETQRVEDVISFIEAKNLHRFVGRGGQKGMRVKATGGGAHRYADIFKEKLGLVLEKEDEMECLVTGCNFLLRAIHDEAFTFKDGTATFVPASPGNLDVYPYLLVNIGSGVSIIKVEGDNQYQRVSGSSLGGGTFWGLCRLLTRRRDFDEMLQLSARGNNANVDMLVGDIYGGRDYSSIGLSASTIASSFGKVVSQDKELEDYEAGDMAVALCRMLAYNIAQLAYLNAVRYNLKRVFFGGFFIRGHPYTMETISYAIKFWSNGEMNATFLRHEGFLGAMGAFLKVNPMQPPTTRRLQQVRSRFMERFSMGAPFSGGEVQGPPIRDLDEKVDWVEKFVQVGGLATREAKAEHDSAVNMLPSNLLSRQASVTDELASPTSLGMMRMNLHVGVLHYTPSLELFPLLADPTNYEPNTLQISEDETELHWWLRVLEEQIPTVVEKAVASEGGGEGPKRRAMACGRAMKAHLMKLRAEPGAYGCLGLAELLEMREDCLREFAFADAYRLDKERENQAALQVLKDLLAELDGMEPNERLLALVQGVLAANIFDWGARACVALYHEGTILDIYRDARHKLSVRPWRVDSFDDFAARVLTEAAPGKPPFRRVMMFVDNAGADVVLGMIPFARELLRLGCEVVMVANSLPAINDITAAELRSLLQTVSEMCPIIKAARQAAILVKTANNGRVPPYPGLTRIRSLSDLTTYGTVPTKPTCAPLGRLLPPTPEQGILAGSPTEQALEQGTARGPTTSTIQQKISDPHRSAASPRYIEPDNLASSTPPTLVSDGQGTQPRETTLVSDGQGTQPRETTLVSDGQGTQPRETTPGGGASAGLLNAEQLYREDGAASKQQSGAVDAGAPGTRSIPDGTGRSPVRVDASNHVVSPAAASDGGADADDNFPPQLYIRTSPGASQAESRTVPPNSIVVDKIKGDSPFSPPSSHKWTHHSATEDRSTGSPLESTTPNLSEVNVPGAKLYVVANGQGSPCLDLRRIPGELADASEGVDLLIIEGMGRSIHTNYNTRFKCDSLKLAMIKTERLAQRLFHGNLYDCVCRFERGTLNASPVRSRSMST